MLPPPPSSPLFPYTTLFRSYAAFRGPAAVYTLSFIAAAGGAMSTVAIKAQSNPRPGEPMSWKTMLAGFHYIRRERLILGSISLDLFAVLLGGAVALLPVYAREILKTGPWGLGILRSAPAAGAATMAALIAHKPLGQRTDQPCCGAWRDLEQPPSFS